MLSQFGGYFHMEKEVRLIQSIQRAFNIINCFNNDNTELSLPQISEKVKLHINTTRGIVNTLVANGYLAYNSEKSAYSLGLVYINKADLATGNNIKRLKKMAAPLLKDIANRFQVSGLLQVITNNNIFTIENISPDNSHYILNSRVNLTYDLNSTASGKLFLAYIDAPLREYYISHMEFFPYTANTLLTREALEAELLKIRANGYSTEFEEIGLGISCIAVPIFKDGESLFGTVSIIASSSVISAVMDTALEPLRNCAQFISENIRP